MKQIASTLLVLLSMTVYTAFAQNAVPVFVSGEEGHKSYRIPAIIKLPNDDLLAFAEGRVHGAGDFGDINIVVKRSADKGKTWSRLQTVVDYDSLQAGNPAPVVDLTDPEFPGGRIFLFYNTGNNHEGEVRKGNGVREVWYMTSTDGGKSWNQPVNITTQVHRPNQPKFNAVYNFREDWRSYANAPGHAMQFGSGKYRDRIFVPANHSWGGPQEQSRDYQAHGFYTDDHGKTFRLGETVSIPGSNEAIATEISGGRLMMNIRNQRGDIRARIVALSNDGGTTWDTAYFDHALPDPVCQGSILTIGQRKGKNVLAFCNAADTEKRDNLTLRISENDGANWTKSYVVDKSTKGEKDFTAYSDIVQISKGRIGVLYERDGYKQIVFKVVEL
jgi:sialidase-1